MTTIDDRLKDIKDNPEKHRHDYTGLIACCMHNGAIDTMIMDAHEGLMGRGKCDVSSGPCACGAWH